MSRRPSKLLGLALGAVGAAVLLSACVGIKFESRSLTQPKGIGVAHVGGVLCTTENAVEESCAPSAESAQVQMLLALVIPIGASAPQSLAVSPSLGPTTLTFTRNAEVGPAFASNYAAGLLEAFLEESLPPVSPAGFEIVGYASNVFSETEGQTQEWPFDAEVGLPPAADGKSYGGPLKVTVLSGWRKISPALPESRPITCGEEEFEESTAICEPNGSESELTLGVSEMKISPPKTVVTTPGATAKLPFSLDFASTATPPPTFTLGATATLKGASVRLSNGEFARGPSSSPPNRAPLTTRKAIVEVPKTALPGIYEVTMTATTPQGGSVSSVGKLRVKPKGKLTVQVPGQVLASQAARRGIPVKVNARTARTKIVARLYGPRPNRAGKLVLAKRQARSKAPGKLVLRLKVGKRRAETLAAQGIKLQALIRVFEPKKKGRTFRRLVRLK